MSAGAMKLAVRISKRTRCNRPPNLGVIRFGLRKYDVFQKDTGIKNTRTLRALLGDQKIDKVFHAIG